MVEEFPFTENEKGMFIRYVPVQDKDELSISWILPYSGLDHASKPVQYHSNLLGHEGPNSLLSYLKKEGLATGLGAGVDHELWGLTSFDVSITLTKKGLENYKQVLESVFKYAQIMRDAGPQQYVFEEVQRLGQIQFNFMSKGKPFDTASSYASRL